MFALSRMAKHRRSAHRKGSRKSHRKSHRKSRRTHRRQRGGAGCAAFPSNFNSLQQRGGMAPFVAGDNYLLDTATRVQAEVGPLDKAFAELPSVIRTQAGGRRKGRKGRKSHRRGRKSQKQSRKQQRRQSRRQRKQRGGMSPFDAPGMLLDKAAYTADGTNPQFRTEGSVNPLYGEFKGAQA